MLKRAEVWARPDMQALGRKEPALKGEGASERLRVMSEDQLWLLCKMGEGLTSIYLEGQQKN